MAPTVTFRLTGDNKVKQAMTRMRDEFGKPDRWLKLVVKEYHKYLVTKMLSGQRLKVRSGELRRAWNYERAGRGRWLLHPGMLPYARVHEFGHKEYQFVRGYTTRSGRRVKSYNRDANIKATRYFTDTIKLAEPGVLRAIDRRALQIIKGKEIAAKRNDGAD